MNHLTTVSARDAKNRFGELLDAARRAPVRISKNGRQVAVMLSIEEFERFEEAEDALWLERAETAHKNADYLGTKNTKAFLNIFLDAGN